MALFKIYRGPEEELQEVPLHDGYAYFTEDQGNLYIDVGDEDGSNVERVKVNAQWADGLRKVDDQGEDIQYIEFDKVALKENIESLRQEFNQTINSTEQTLQEQITQIQEAIGDTQWDVAHGGTGQTSLTINALLIGNGTNAVKMVVAGQNEFVLGDSANGVKSVDGTGFMYKALGNAPTFLDAAGVRNQIDVYNKTEVQDLVNGATTTVYSENIAAASWQASGSEFIYEYRNSALKCGADGNVPPIISPTSNVDEYSNITSAEANAGVGITFHIGARPSGSIGILIVDNK